MKPLVFAIVTALSAAAVAGQSVDDPAAVVKTMFAAMQAKDTAAIRAAWHPAVRLIATAIVEGAPAYRVGSIDGWIRGVGRSTANIEERTYDHETRVDVNLATVWTRYEFFRDGNFSHCGIDAYQLVKLGGKWLIAAGADTGRRTPEECGRGTAPKAIPAPSSADTAAVIAAVQKLFDAMAAADTTAAKAVFIAEGLIGGLRPDATEFRLTPSSTWAGSLTRVSAQGKLIEKMYRPEVRISDNLAEVWTYYDFHIGERFSHCGFDTAQLVRTTEDWKIATISYTARTTGCEPPK
jgi:uncharacterized protein YchJ